MAALIRPVAHPRGPVTGGGATEQRRFVRDSLVVSLGGQVERVVGTLTSLVLRWGLDPAQLGVYLFLRLYLDQTNRTSLGIGLGAVQEIPILRAAGREDEARRVADVAYTTNSLTCLLYALVLCVWAWLRLPLLKDDPLAAEWTWGLVAVAGLTLVKRYESFLIAVHRAHREFLLTTELDLLEGDRLRRHLRGRPGRSAGCRGLDCGGRNHPGNQDRLPPRPPSPAVPLGLGRRDGGAVDAARVADSGQHGGVQRRTECRPGVGSSWPGPRRALLAHVRSLQHRAAARQTSWSLDLAGRLVLVLYTSLQTTLGRTGDIAAVARQAAATTEAQATPLAAGSAVALLVGPLFLGTLLPRYAEGLPVLGPLLPGMVLLGLAWPARQLLITIGQPYRLCLATTAGLAMTVLAGWVGADRAGIVGVAWGMSLGYAAVYLLTSAAAFYRPALGLGRAGSSISAGLPRTLAWFAAGAWIAGHAPIAEPRQWLTFAGRCVVLVVWMLPALIAWGRRHQWGGLLG